MYVWPFGTEKKVLDKDGKTVSRYLHSRLYGRVLSEDIKVNKKIVQLDNKDKTKLVKVKMFTDVWWKQ